METLHNAYLWVCAHWEVVSLVATLLLAVIPLVNKLTTHWTGHEKLAYVLTKATEYLSYLTSKDVPGWFKWPFTSVSPAEAAMKQRQSDVRAGRLGCSLAPLLLAGGLAGMLLLGASGCVCSSPRACLATAQKAVVLADKPALKLLGDKCMAEATKCGAVTSAKCPGWQACDKARAAYQAAMDGIDGSLATCNRVLYDLGVK